MPACRRSRLQSCVRPVHAVRRNWSPRTEVSSFERDRCPDENGRLWTCKRRFGSKTEIRMTKSIHPRARPRLAADLTGQCGLLALPFLVPTRLPAHIFQKPAHSVELRAETRPVSGFQALHCLIVVVEC